MAVEDEPILVLYIEDNPANFALVRKVLESTNLARVLGAPDAEAGLQAILDQRPDVVLLDLDLPGMNGIELTRKIKGDSTLADLPVIAISASVMKRERNEALQAGCVSFLEKPFDIDRLRSLVQEAYRGQARGQGD